MSLLSRVSLAALAIILCVSLVSGQQPKAGALVTQPRSTGAELPTELGGKNIKQWISEISSHDPSRRENAIRTVVLMRDSEKALPALLERIERDTDTSPRVNAIMALGAIFIRDDDVPKVIRALVPRLRSDSQSIIRFQAALVLGRFGELARPAMNDLVSATRDQGSWEIRKAAVFALARTIFDSKTPVNSVGLAALLERISPTSEPSALVRLEATMSIATIGRLTPADNVKVVSVLKRAEEDRERMVAIWARVGLMVHNNQLTDEDMTALVRFLRTSEPLQHRTHAARALGFIASVGNPGPAMKMAIPPLIQMLKDKEELAQIAAIWALGRIGPPAKSALDPLNAMLQDRTMSEEGKSFVKEAIAMIEGRGAKQ